MRRNSSGRASMRPAERREHQLGKFPTKKRAARESTHGMALRIAALTPRPGGRQASRGARALMRGRKLHDGDARSSRRSHRSSALRGRAPTTLCPAYSDVVRPRPWLLARGAAPSATQRDRCWPARAYGGDEEAKGIFGQALGERWRRRQDGAPPMPSPPTFRAIFAAVALVLPLRGAESANAEGAPRPPRAPPARVEEPDLLYHGSRSSANPVGDGGQCVIAPASRRNVSAA